MLTDSSASNVCTVTNWRTHFRASKYMCVEIGICSVSVVAVGMYYTKKKCMRGPARMVAFSATDRGFGQG